MRPLLIIIYIPTSPSTNTDKDIITWILDWEILNARINPYYILKIPALYSPEEDLPFAVVPALHSGFVISQGICLPALCPNSLNQVQAENNEVITAPGKHRLSS